MESPGPVFRVTNFAGNLPDHWYLPNLVANCQLSVYLRIQSDAECSFAYFAPLAKYRRGGPPVTCQSRGKCNNMAADPIFMLALLQRENRRALRRERLFRDRNNPLEKYDDVEIFTKFRFPRHEIFRIIDDVANELRAHRNRPQRTSLTISMEVCLALRFYATGTFQDVCGELVNASQPTVSRAVTKVTNALLPLVPTWIQFPVNQDQANRQMLKFRAIAGFRGVVGCVDGTHVEIQAPSDNEHEYVNRKGRHSINVMVITDADLKFIEVAARWPGSVHDARVLRESALFEAFEGPARPIRGYVLGDSGYMLRTWLLTPVLNPATNDEHEYNARHSSTRCTVERAIGICKRRWPCLNKLRFTPAKSCDVILVCMMLNNRARSINLPDPEDLEAEPEQDVADPVAEGQQLAHNERARAAAGRAERQQVILDGFPNFDDE